MKAQKEPKIKSIRDKAEFLIAPMLLIILLLCLPVIAGAKGLDCVIYKERGYGSSQKGLWGVRLRFNRQVFPSDLKKALEVTMGNKKVPIGLTDPESGLTSEEAARSFRVVPDDRKIRTSRLELKVDAGLTDSSGRWTLGKDRKITFWAMNMLEVVRNLQTFYRSDKDFGVRFSLRGNPRGVSEDELEKAISVKPDIGPIEVEKAGYNRWVVRGEFEKDKDYVLQVAPTSLAQGQARLKKASISFKGPGKESLIAFRTDGSVIELKGRQLLPIKLNNVTKLRCSVTRIPPYFTPEAIDAFKSKKRKRGEKETAGKGPDLEKIRSGVAGLKEKGGPVKNFISEVNSDADVFFTRPHGGNKAIGYSAPLSFRPEPERGGAWVVELKDLDGNFEKTVSKLVQITDLSISYKISSNKLLIWVTSIHSGQPVAGVEILLRSSDGQAFILGKSGKDGVLLVENGTEAKVVAGEADKKAEPIIDLGKAEWIVAATPTDAAVTRLDTNRIKPFSIEQSKDFKTPHKALTGYLFTERGVYRPGEQVHFKFMQRLYKKGAIRATKEEKVNVEIWDPRREVHYSKQLELNEFGACHDSFRLEKYFKTGTYTIRVRSRPKWGKDETWTRDFLVAEYKRPRHFVEISMERDTRTGDKYVGVDVKEETLRVRIQGKYYAGGPVKNANTRWKASLKPITNSVEGVSGYHFGNQAKKTIFLESGEASLDEKGALEIAIPMDSRLLSGLYGIKVSATVLDIDGEPATTVKTYNPKPQFLVGISEHPEKIPRDYTGTLKVIVVDRDGQRVQSGKIITKVMKRSYYYTHRRDSLGNINYVWQEGWQKMISSTTPIEQGVARVKVNFSGYQDYMIRCEYVADSGIYVSQTRFDIGWDSYEDWIQPKMKDGAPTTDAIFLSMPSKDYKVGDTVNIDFETKRPVGKMLISIEGRNLFEYRVIDLNGKNGSFSFKVLPEHRPNAFISVMAAAGRGHYPVYQVQTDKDIPTIYFGYAGFRARTKLPRLQVAVTPDGDDLKGRPGESKKLDFRVTDRDGNGVKSELTVCVVDEAVLALTGFSVPDLSKLADFSIPLGVFSGDLRLDLISQDLFRIFSTTPVTGGGAGAGMISSTIRKDFRPVAYFNPALVTDEKGNASVEFELPDTTTSYRIYVVAADKGSGFASNHWNMVVNKEFFIEPALTRFLIPGDKLTFPLSLNNRTDMKGDAMVEAESSDNLKLTLASPSKEIAPWQSETAMAEAEITGGVEALFRFKGVMDTEKGRFGDIIERRMPVESKYLPIHRSIWGSFSKEGRIVPKFQKGVSINDYRQISPADLSAVLTLSLTNWNRIAPGLKYLLRYPYGCVEQTSSGLIPLAAMRGLVKDGRIPGVEIDTVDKFIESGVNRLLSMQTETGGFSYWPGDLNPSWWGSMYATAALTLLERQGGYEIPHSRLTKASEYLRKGLFNDVSRDGRHGGAWIRELAVYNLAMNRKLTPYELDKMFQDYDNMSEQAKAFLILAATEVGAQKEANNQTPSPDLLKKLAKELKPDIKGPAKTGYRNSTYRTVAICLLAGVQVNLDKAMLDSWAGYLLKSLKSDGRWVSTADTGFCLAALSKYFRKYGSANDKEVVCKIKIPGGQEFEREVSAATAHLEIDASKLIGSEPIRISANNKALVHYTLDLTYPDLANDPAHLKQGFTLRKRIENLNGKEEIRVGDVLRVTLDLQISKELDKDNTVEYLALEDPTPAGITPINSDLKTEGVDDDASGNTRTSWKDPRIFRPSHSEFRDDGVRVFKDKAWPGFYRYTYLARAVAQGDFWMRGSRVSLMYDPDSFGKTLGKRVTILPAK